MLLPFPISYPMWNTKIQQMSEYNKKEEKLTDTENKSNTLPLGEVEGEIQGWGVGGTNHWV